MRISTKDFEKAVEIGHEHGVRDALAHFLTPDERKQRVQRAVLDAYDRVVAEQSIILECILCGGDHTYHDCLERNP